MKKNLFTGIVLLVVFLQACQPATHNFTAEELKIIDSLYQLQVDSVETIMKNRCDSIFLEVYDGIVDSMKSVRKQEIFEIIGE